MPVTITPKFFNMYRKRSTFLNLGVMVTGTEIPHRQRAAASPKAPCGSENYAAIGARRPPLSESQGKGRG